MDLSERGREEAIHAGLMLKRYGFEFDEAHTSLLKRAVRTSRSRRPTTRVENSVEFWSVVEASVEARDDREYSGKPRDLCSSVLELSRWSQSDTPENDARDTKL